jgi:phenylacetate-CoA ligase
MTLATRIHELVAGAVIFPLSNELMNRRGIVRTAATLRQLERLPADRLEEIQMAKARAVIRHAQRWVPFYRQRFKNAGITADDITRREHMSAIPLLSRDDVISHCREMVDERYRSSIAESEKAGRNPGEPRAFARFWPRSLVRNTSSGSTGAPTVFYEDGSVAAANWANELRLRSWYGIPAGAKEARMARVSADFSRKSRSTRFRWLLWNQLVLPGISLTEKEYEFCYEALRKFQPRVLWGFTSALAGLAAFIRDRHKEGAGIGPELIITWAAPLYDHEKKILEEVFRCPVSNVYGSRETGHIASVCQHGSMHIHDETHLAETVSSTVSGSTTEELVVTPLVITPMPFIRYRMGDLGRIAFSPCACGRSLRRISDFNGRTGEVFYTKSRVMISPNFWCRMFMNPALAQAVRRFQIVYESPNQIRVRLEKSDGFTEETQQHIALEIRQKIGQEILTSFEHTDKIAPQISGKYQMVINQFAAHVN